MTNYDEDETSWTTITLVFTIIIATLGYRIFGPDRAQEPVVVPETKSTVKQKEVTPISLISYLKNASGRTKGGDS